MKVSVVFTLKNVIGCFTETVEVNEVSVQAVRKALLKMIGEFNMPKANIGQIVSIIEQ